MATGRVAFPPPGGVTDRAHFRAALEGAYDKRISIFKLRAALEGEGTGPATRRWVSYPNGYAAMVGRNYRWVDGKLVDQIGDTIEAISWTEWMESAADAAYWLACGANWHRAVALRGLLASGYPAI